MEFIDQDFLNTVLLLLNSEPDVPEADNGTVKPAWWKEAVFINLSAKFSRQQWSRIGDLQGHKAIT